MIKRTSQLLLGLMIIGASHFCFAQSKSSASISVTSKDLLYVGIENPVTITTQGITEDKITVSISEGTITGGNGKYIAVVSQNSTVTIDVSSEGKKIGFKEFTVKTIPDPVIYVSGKTSEGVITKEELMKLEAIDYKIDNIDADVKFWILSFDLTINMRDKEGKSELVTEPSGSKKLTDKQKEYLSQAKSGNKIYFENIKVKGSDGSIRKLPGVNLKLK